MSNGRTTQVRKTGRLRAAGVVLLLPLALAGCLADKPDASRPDPLTGLPKRIPASQREVASTYTPADRPATPTTFAVSTARVGDGASGLSIRDGRPADGDRNVQATGAWTGNESRSAPPAAGGAKLGNPGSSSRGSDAYSSPAANSGAGVRVRTFEEAQQFLMARGVKWQDLQTTGEGEWKYSCTVPIKNNPTSMRTYESSDRYGLLAMQKVIDQIIRDQGR